MRCYPYIPNQFLIYLFVSLLSLNMNTPVHAFNAPSSSGPSWGRESGIVTIPPLPTPKQQEYAPKVIPQESIPTEKPSSERETATQSIEAQTIEAQKPLKKTEPSAQQADKHPQQHPIARHNTPPQTQPTPYPAWPSPHTNMRPQYAPPYYPQPAQTATPSETTKHKTATQRTNPTYPPPRHQNYYPTQNNFAMPSPFGMANQMMPFGNFSPTSNHYPSNNFPPPQSPFSYTNVPNHKTPSPTQPQTTPPLNKE
ncbi:hypothetical protein ACQZV8_12485 [Magnetococcales bacterium HHB-1]